MSRSTAVVWIAGLAVVVASGCAQRTVQLYDWGTYETALQAAYLESDHAQAAAELEATVTRLQTSPSRVPPGVYADLGFYAYRRGDKQAAVALFQQEAAAYPEAAPLMTRLIARAEREDPGERTETEGEGGQP